MDWKIIKLQNELFVIKFTNESSKKCIVSLSNFKVLWRETISWTEIYNRAKSSNPIINVDALMEKTIEQTISTVPDNNYQFNPNDFTFKMKYYISGCPFHFYWKFTRCDEDVFYEEITKKLLVSLLNVQDQRNELIDVVTKKDLEIKQYKIEGATLVRKHVATQAFVEQEFNRKFALKSNSAMFDFFTKDTNGIKNMCNYKNAMEKDDASAIQSSSNEGGPSPKKISKKSSNKEQNAMRKFQTKKEKVIYDSPEMLLSDGDNCEEVMAVTNTIVINDTDSTNQKPPPKRKLLKSKLNL